MRNLIYRFVYSKRQQKQPREELQTGRKLTKQLQDTESGRHIESYFRMSAELFIPHSGVSCKVQITSSGVGINSRRSRTDLGQTFISFPHSFFFSFIFFCLPKGLHKSKRYGCFNILLKIYAKRFNEIFGKATLNMSLSRQTKSKI